MRVSPRRLPVVVAAAVVAAAGLTGCVKNTHVSLPQGAALVVIQHMRFNPPVVTINQGQTVVWEFDDQDVSHDVRSQPAGPLKSKIQQTGTYQYTFRAPGTYRYICTLHLNDGMIGDVIVR
jgi:plastocyanin